jgi:hypothetical protein
MNPYRSGLYTSSSLFGAEEQRSLRTRDTTAEEGVAAQAAAGAAEANAAQLLLAAIDGAQTLANLLGSISSLSETTWDNDNHLVVVEAILMQADSMAKALVLGIAALRDAVAKEKEADDAKSTSDPAETDNLPLTENDLK